MYTIIVAVRFFLSFLDLLLIVYIFCNIIAVITRKTNPFFNFIFGVCEPLLRPIRSLLNKIPALQGIPIDFSVLVAFFILSILRSII